MKPKVDPSIQKALKKPLPRGFSMLSVHDVIMTDGLQENVVKF